MNLSTPGSLGGNIPFLLVSRVVAAVQVMDGGGMAEAHSKAVGGDTIRATRAATTATVFIVGI